MSTLTQWVLYTNLLALISAISFFYFKKGGVVSVLGSIFLILNFIQMIVLFIYAQVKVFDSEIKNCQSSAVDKNSAFVWQYWTILAYIIIQYTKLLIVISAVIFLSCCLKASKSRQRPGTENPNLERAIKAPPSFG